MILTFSLSGLPNAQLLSFGQSLDVLLSPIENSIAQIYNPFKQALTLCEETSNEAISKQVAQQQTEKLSVCDLKRDNLFRGVKYVIQAYALHPDKEKQEAATELEKVVSKVGWNLHRESYDRQSALLKTLIKELSGKHADRVALVGLSDYADLLNTTQNEFDSLRQEQLEQQAGMEEISSMTAVRGQLEKSIKDLLEILPGYYRMTADEALGGVLPKIKELIDRNS